MNVAAGRLLNQFSLQSPFTKLDKITYQKPLRQDQINDIRSMMRKQPVIQTAMRNFQDIVFSEPFELVLGSEAGDGFSSSASNLLNLRPEFRNTIIQNRWMPWLRDVDLLTTAYGIAPFYYDVIKQRVAVEDEDEDSNEAEGEEEPSTLEENANNTSPKKRRQVVKEILFHFPTSPSIDMGSIEIFVYDKKPHLIWKWGQHVGSDLAGQYDTNMFFIIESMPSLDGSINSRLGTLLAPFKHLEALQMHDIEIVKRIANPEHVIEYTPNISALLKDKDQAYIQGLHPSSMIPSITLGMNTSAATTQMMGNTPGERIGAALGAVQDIHRAQVAGQFGTSDGRINAGLDPVGAVYKSTPSQNQDPAAREAFNKLNLYVARNPDIEPFMHLVNTTLSNATYLNPYERYVPIHTPTNSLSAQVLTLQDDFERLATNVLNAPSSMNKQSAVTNVTAGILSQENNMRQRIKFRIKFFCSAVKKVFSIAYMTMFEKAYSDMNRLLKYHLNKGLTIEKMIAIEQALDFKVIFKPANAMMDINEIAELYHYGVINEDEAFNMMYSRIGFTDPPLKAPAEFKKQMELLFRSEEFQREQEVQNQELAVAAAEAAEKAPEKPKSKPASAQKRPRDEGADKDEASKAKKKAKK